MFSANYTTASLPERIGIINDCAREDGELEQYAAPRKIPAGVAGGRSFGELDRMFCRGRLKEFPSASDHEDTVIELIEAHRAETKREDEWFRAPFPAPSLYEWDDEDWGDGDDRDDEGWDDPVPPPPPPPKSGLFVKLVGGAEVRLWTDELLERFGDDEPGCEDFVFKDEEPTETGEGLWRPSSRERRMNFKMRQSRKQIGKTQYRKARGKFVLRKEFCVSFYRHAHKGRKCRTWRDTA
ncbi:hypothetical protein EPN90_00175 [Patescibacteria group bacterium]|nr:MAG: hypothetical protein EPN90_00175 [Patescibacteria group bacterium]